MQLAVNDPPGELLRNRDPDHLPYCVIRVATHRSVRVGFQPLQSGDEAELRGPAWSGAVFREVWPGWIGEPGTYKLVRRHGQDRRIQGLLHLGRVERDGGALRDSLLETAPYNRERLVAERTYRGVGRVLVARLVLESYRQGGLGQVLVRARPGIEPFYLRLGFRRVPGAGAYFFLEREGATDLLRAALRTAGRRRGK